MVTDALRTSGILNGDDSDSEADEDVSGILGRRDIPEMLNTTGGVSLACTSTGELSRGPLHIV